MRINYQNKIGIVIPYINCAEYAIKAIASISTKFSYELVLIDNGSDQKNKEMMKDFEDRYSTTLLIQDRNIGCAGAWNLGMTHLFRNSEINHVAILNNDIILHPECLDRLFTKQVLSGFPIVTATDRAADCNEPKDILKFPIPEIERLSENPEFSCFMISRRAFITIGLFDEKFYPAYFEDNDYHYRVRLKEQRAIKLNQALYYHFGSRTIKQNEDINTIVNTYFLQNEQYFIEKWGGKPGHEKNKIPFMGRRWT